eukprot:c24343_g1_i1 orf=420-1634(-)
MGILGACSSNISALNTMLYTSGRGSWELVPSCPMQSSPQERIALRTVCTLDGDSDALSRNIKASAYTFHHLRRQDFNTAVQLLLPCHGESHFMNWSLKISKCLQIDILSYRRHGSWVCFGGGKRSRSPRVWRTKQRRGTFSKSDKLLEKVRSLSNVKEEIYGALDAFIAWELEFPLIAVKKALRTLQFEKDWKRIIQISKWMLSKGQGKTMGTYSLLLQAFDEEGRIEEAEELWDKIFKQNLEYTPRSLFSHVISMYGRNGMYDKLLELFADMEELQVRPDIAIVKIVAHAYKKLGMLDKSEKVLQKYPPPVWDYRYFKGKRVRVKVQEAIRDAFELSREDPHFKMSQGENDLSLNQASILDVNSAAVVLGSTNDSYNALSELEDLPSSDGVPSTEQKVTEESP